MRRYFHSFNLRSRRYFFIGVAGLFIFGVAYLLWPKQTQSTVVPPPAAEQNTPPQEIIPTPQAFVELIPNFAEGYDVAPAAQAPGTVRIPIFAYHHIAAYDPATANMSAEYYVTPEAFRSQMQYLKDKGYRTIGPAEFWQQVQTGQNPVQKTVMLSFGDGYADNYSTAFPILQEFGFTGVFFIITDRQQISDAQLQEMEAAGMFIQNHTSTHTSLAASSDLGFLDYEMNTSKRKLEVILGHSVDSLLFPACAYTDLVITYLQIYGYNYAFGCYPTIDHSVAEQYHFGRLYAYESLEDFKNKLSGVF